MNLLPIVQAVASEHPGLLQVNTNATCFLFTQLVLARLKAQGYEGWGHVGKTAGEGQYTPPGFSPHFERGSDGVLYMITGVSHDAIFNKNLHLQVDLLGGGNDGPDPLGAPARPQWAEIDPQWYRVNNPWIAPLPTQPVDVPAPPPVPPAPTIKPRQQFYDELRAIDRFYAAPEGLQRLGGMVIERGGVLSADVEALGAWGYNLMMGATVDQCKEEIRQSDEWKGKHHGG